MNAKALIKHKPQQGRAQITLSRILESAQTLLVEGGFEALNSNAIVEHLGMTPPTFYRYFDNKHDLLRVLCQNLMDTQNQLLLDEKAWDTYASGGIRTSARRTIEQTLNVTREFKAGHVLLQLLRAIPELQPIRTQSHDEMATLMARKMSEGRGGDVQDSLETRARLIVEMGYSVIEMLFDTHFKNQELVIERMSFAMEAIFSDIDLTR